MAVPETILSFVQNQGPVVPTQVAKELKTDSILASAHLAELVSRKKIKISKLRVGSSPLYFLPGQESKLVEFADNLKEREKEAFLLLQEKKLLRDQKLPPAIRVALRAIEDYAVSVQVKHGGTTELFWRWYLLGQSEAEKLIREAIVGQKRKQKEPLQQKEQIKQLEPVKEEEQKTRPQQKTLEPEQRIQPPPPKLEKKEEKIAEKTEIGDQAVEKREIKEQKLEPITKKDPETKVEKKTDDQDILLSTNPEDIKDDFFQKVHAYLKTKNISLKDFTITKKNSEIDCIVELPSTVGKLTYYCRAKNKKRVSDPDLASAFVQGQFKKLPVLFITPGILTKKAKTMMENEFKNITLNQLQ